MQDPNVTAIIPSRKRIVEWLGSKRGFTTLAVFSIAESCSTSFVYLPMVPFSQQEAQLFLPAAFLGLSRVFILLLMLVEVRHNTGYEGSVSPEKVPRSVASSATGLTFLLASYFLTLAVWQPWDPSRVRRATFVCGLVVFWNFTLLLPLHLSIRQLMRIPKRTTATAFLMTEERMSELEEPFCSICIAEIRHNDLIGQLPCAHFFHLSCVNDWLQVRPRCPLRCPEPVFPAELPPEDAEEQPPWPQLPPHAPPAAMAYGRQQWPTPLRLLPPIRERAAERGTDEMHSVLPGSAT